MIARSKRKTKPHKFYALIIILVIIVSIVSIPIVILAFSIFETIKGSSGLPCEELPDIETVRQIIEDHQDLIEEIENTSPGNVWVEINERCDGKGELFIYYDTIYTKNKIKELIGGDTFFGVPYRMFNV
ncbi:MAG: hypothetical protein CEE42_02445 [Promethearchaeota archaeon Loki_b31]|nr:MAG: hypothetical protein CEE42_02445 [Candidatus Lokiarchaeota archaeon Loki_b31]